MFKRQNQNILIKTLWALSALSSLAAFTNLIPEFKLLKRAKLASGDQALMATGHSCVIYFGPPSKHYPKSTMLNSREKFTDNMCCAGCHGRNHY